MSLPLYPVNVNPPFSLIDGGNHPTIGASQEGTSNVSLKCSISGFVGLVSHLSGISCGIVDNSRGLLELAQSTTNDLQEMETVSGDVLKILVGCYSQETPQLPENKLFGGDNLRNAKKIPKGGLFGSIHDYPRGLKAQYDSCDPIPQLRVIEELLSPPNEKKVVEAFDHKLPKQFEKQQEKCFVGSGTSLKDKNIKDSKSRRVITQPGARSDTQREDQTRYSIISQLTHKLNLGSEKMMDEAECKGFNLAPINLEMKELTDTFKSPIPSLGFYNSKAEHAEDANPWRFSYSKNNNSDEEKPKSVSKLSQENISQHPDDATLLDQDSTYNSKDVLSSLVPDKSLPLSVKGRNKIDSALCIYTQCSPPPPPPPYPKQAQAKSRVRDSSIKSQKSASRIPSKDFDYLRPVKKSENSLDFLMDLQNALTKYRID